MKKISWWLFSGALWLTRRFDRWSSLVTGVCLVTLVLTDHPLAALAVLVTAVSCVYNAASWVQLMMEEAARAEGAPAGPRHGEGGDVIDKPENDQEIAIGGEVRQAEDGKWSVIIDAWWQGKHRRYIKDGHLTEEHARTAMRLIGANLEHMIKALGPHTDLLAPAPRGEKEGT